MANNWLPPYGSPFTLPPQTPQLQHQAPGPQHHAHGEPSHANPAPADTPRPPWPGLWGIPGLNLQSYGQNNQQPQYPPAWPPPPVPSADAWNQMHMHLPFLTQNGPITPPPRPGYEYAPASQPQIPLQATAPNFVPTPTAQPNLTYPPRNERHTIVSDSDKEDGEVSDGDRTSQAPLVKGRGQQFPEPPRSAPAGIPRSAPVGIPRSAIDAAADEDEPYNPDQPAAGSMFRALTQRERETVDASSSVPVIVQKREDAKQFIKLLHSNNIGYHALASEVSDSGPLRELYRSLNLPSEPEPVPLAINSNKASASSILPQSNMSRSMVPVVNGASSTTAVNTNVASVPPAKSAPSPIDRKDYIARLQAAKLAKQGAGAKTTPPQNTPPATSAFAPPVKPPGQSTVAKQTSAIEDEKKARTTELIRQRLEALKRNPTFPVAPPAPKSLVTEDRNVVAASSSAAEPAASPSDIQQPQPILPSFSGIPGLFMNSSAATSPSHVPSTLVQHIGSTNSRKRPLAADFMEDTTLNVPDAGQPGSTDVPPGGQGYEPMIVDVIDPEISPGGGPVSDDHMADSSALSHSSPNKDGQLNTRNPTAIPDFASRAASANPVSSVVSTPGPQTPASTARFEELGKKEQELAAMKARLQKKMKEAREKKLAEAASTPQTPSATPGLPRFKPQDVATTSAQPEHYRSSSVCVPAPVSVDEAVRASKRRRRAEIQSGLPSLDAEIANNAAKMAQLTKEMELLAANNERMKQDKERLVEELESLGVDTEGMQHAELQAKKDEIEREQEAASPEVRTGPNLDTEDNLEDIFIALPLPHDIPDIFEIKNGTSSQPSQLAELTNTAQQPMGIPGLNASVVQQPAVVPVAALPKVPLSSSFPFNVGSSQPQISAQPAALVTADDESLSKVAPTQQPTTPLEDEEDFYSPEPASSMPTNVPVEASAAPLTNAKTPSEEGEVAMSESEEEYEPEEPSPVPNLTLPNGILADTAVETSSASSLTSSSAASDDGEAYEPPDIDEPMSDVEHSEPVVDLDASAQHGEGEDGAMDISMESSDDSNEYPSAPPSTTGNNTPEFTAFAQGLEQSSAVADVPAPELQAESAVDAFSSGLAADNDTEIGGFVPYESPLKLFKSYRYHPNYPDEVLGGFLSMTYSHQIDPNEPLCATEASGATCEDPACLNQHFGGMNITGEKLLVQLGTAYPGKTAEGKQLWNDGLRGVLKDLRQKNTKDPHGIAMEIARFRRQFLNDDTRVVNF